MIANGESDIVFRREGRPGRKAKPKSDSVANFVHETNGEGEISKDFDLLDELISPLRVSVVFGKLALIQRGGRPWK